MSGLTLSSVVAPVMQFQRNSSRTLKYRHCLDCPADLSEVHGNIKRCTKCRKALHKKLRQHRYHTERAECITPRDIVLHLQAYAPQSLEKIKARIMKLRTA